MTVLASCKICGKNDFRFIFKNKDRMHHLAGEFDYYRCQRCGVVIYGPLLSGEGLAAYYPKDYYSYEAAETHGEVKRRRAAHYICHPLQGANALFYSKILAQNRDAVFQENQTVLDVGCGDGSYLLQENKKNCRTYGVDIDGEALKRLKAKNPSTETFCGNLWDAGFAAEFFDHIQLSHVAEHVEQVDKLLWTVSNILKKDGMVRLQIPNTASLTRIIFGRFWIHWDSPRHIYGFSRTNFSKLAYACGLKVAYSRTIENSFSVLGSLVYFFNEITGRKSKLMAASRFWDSEILKFILFPYSFFVNLLGAGDTIEFILKKRVLSA